MDVSVGRIRRLGSELKFESAPGSSIEAEITVSAGEVLSILGKLMSCGGGLVFVFGLPFFWLRERFGSAPPADPGAAHAPRADINKPW